MSGGGRRFWDQHIAALLVRPLIGTPVTPNQVTALSLIVGLAGGWLFALGAPAAHWGAVLFMVAALLDHCDGELARATGTTSRFGHHFDVAAGGLVHVALYTGIGIGLRDGTLGGWAPVMGIVAGVTVGAIFIVRVDLERRKGADAIDQPQIAGFEAEDFMYLVGPITWFGGLTPFLTASCIGAPLYLAWQLLAYRRPMGSGSA